MYYPVFLSCHIASASLLVVGGLCFGWNLANLGTWASLLQYEKPVQAQYDASELLALQALLTANGQEPSAMQEPSATKEPSAIQEPSATKEPSVEGKPSTQNEPSTEQLASGAQNLTASTESATSSDAASAADDPKPIVLGYQGGRIIDVDELSRESLANNVLNEDNSVNTPLDPISLDLLNRVNQAAAQIDGSDDLTSVDSSNFQNNEGTQSAVSPQTSYKDLPRIDQLSIALQTEIPSMSFSAHLYSSQVENRWVRVNGRRLMEGDYIAEGLQLVNIEPQTVILGFKGEVFTMNALTDW